MKKRIISIMLCCVLSVAMVLPAFADEIVTQEDLVNENESTIDDELETEKEPVYEDEALIDDESVTDESENEVLEVVEAFEDFDDDSLDPVPESADLATDDESESLGDIPEDGYPTYVVSGDWCYYIDLSDKSKGIKISAYKGSANKITIPSRIDGYVVTSIADCTFEDEESLTSITIPNSVTNIGISAFEDCIRLTNITIPNSVTSIGSSAFSNCPGLTSISIPSGITLIDNSTFNGCRGLKSITIPNKVTKIGTYAFLGCSSLKSVTIPNGVASIGRGAFYDCRSLKKIDIPKSVTNIDNEAFGYYCEDFKNKKDSSFTISGYTGSAAEKYAKNNGFKFISKDICSYKVAFDGNGATSGNMSSITCKKDKSYALTANTYKRTGYTFNGWNTKKDGSGKKYANKATIKNLTTKNGTKITLYAQWIANKYTIKFNANGGNGNMKSKSMTYNKKAKLSKNAYTRKGYTFLGWSTDKQAAKAKYKNQAEVKNLTSKNGGTVTLYAVWKKK